MKAVFTFNATVCDCNQPSERELTSFSLCCGRSSAWLDVNVIVVMY